MPSNPRKWAAAALAAGLVLAACGDDSDADTDTGSDDVETPAAGTSEGEISISGSSTVAPISSLDRRRVQRRGLAGPDLRRRPGTGDGFAAFCEGDIDIADASRPINEEEAALCADAGIEFVELEVAFDGITVLTNPANDAVECLTTGDLYALIGPESEGFESWSDGQDIATALGSSTELPDAPLDITAPGTESGTYDAFAELALGDPSEARLASGDITEDQVETLREDYSAQADDNAIIAGIEGSDSSFGCVGFAFAEGAGDAIAEIARRRR